MIAAYLKKTPEEVALATTFNALKVRYFFLYVIIRNNFETIFFISIALKFVIEKFTVNPKPAIVKNGD